MLLHTLAGIAWDPQIRGFLAVLVGVVVLMGSVYLLLATNLGIRLAFLLASAAFFGWLMLMGIVWWTYGTIGMLGEAPHWVVQETVYPGLEDAALDEAHALDTSALPPPEEFAELDEDQIAEAEEAAGAALAGWRLLPEADPSFGEAKATVDEHFAEHPNAELEIETSADYVTVYSFERGGKDQLPDDPSRWDRITTKFKTTFVQLTNPPKYAIIQVQPVIEQEPVPGEPPPTPEADPDKPVVSVVMVRDLGDVRFPGAMLTIFSGIVFGVLCLQLHRRDERVAQVRGLSPATES